MSDKFSYYNNIVEGDNIYLLYNALANSYLALSEELYQQVYSYKSNICYLRQVNEKLYNILKDNGFVVEESFDEQQYVRNKRLLDVFHSSEYFCNNQS